MGMFFSQPMITANPTAQIPQSSPRQPNGRLKNLYRSSSDNQEYPVEFALRAKLDYTGSVYDGAPIPGKTISFKKGDCLHIKKEYDIDWWIGRLVKEGTELGFVPSTIKLRNIIAHNLETINQPGPSFMPSWSRPARRNSELENYERLYDVIPTMRPIVLIGPSLRGCAVTDLMQSTILNYLKCKFRGRIIVTSVSQDLTLARRSTNSPASEIRSEVERIFSLSRTLQLVVLDCDAINHPSQLMDNFLDPILVYVKISSMLVLKGLIKEQAKPQAHHGPSQLAAAERLAYCPRQVFDIILNDSLLESKCEHLARELEVYWRATRSAGPGFGIRTGSKILHRNSLGSKSIEIQITPPPFNG